MFSIRLILKSILILVLILSFQNCQNNSLVSNLSASGENQVSNESGNGGTYDGKLTYLNLQAGFTCENQEAPVSVLRRSHDGQWSLLKNSKEKCGNTSVQISQPDSFNRKSILSYEGNDFYIDNNAPEYSRSLQNYVEEIRVNTTSDSNTEDINIGDGICLDKNGLCSLRAAIQEANAEKAKARLILLPAGEFRLDRTIDLKSESFLGIFGSGSDKTIIKVADEAGSIVTPFNYTSLTSLRDLSFQNGQSAISYGATVLKAIGSVELRNVLISKNRSSPTGNPAIRAGVNARDVFIFDSDIVDNESSAIEIFGPDSILIRNSNIARNKGYGVNVSNGSWRVHIENSKILGNIFGVKLRKCYLDCKISDSIIANNFSYGLMLGSTNYISEDTYVKNTTIAFNAITSGANLHLVYPLESPRNFQMNSSIIARGTNTRPNCEIVSDSTSFSLKVLESKVDDDSCPSGFVIVPPFATSVLNL